MAQTHSSRARLDRQVRLVRRALKAYRVTRAALVPPVLLVLLAQQVRAGPPYSDSMVKTDKTR